MPLPGEESIVVLADYGLLGLKPGAIESVPEATREAFLAVGIDYVLASLGKRAKRPVVAVDDALKTSMVTYAFWRAILSRGFKPDAGRDNEIVRAYEENEKYLDLVRSGKIEPWYTDSSTTTHEMGPLAGSSTRSDELFQCAPERVRRCRCL